MSRSTYPLANKALGGQLEERLRQAREQGRSYESIARDLHREGIEVSGETVRQWFAALPSPEAAS